jgi:glutathione S-transferase
MQRGEAPPRAGERLAQAAYLAGEEYSLADIINFPVAILALYY